MELYTKYELQIKRIQKKFKEAKRKDSKYVVFGASYHKYIIGPTLSLDEVQSFEAKFQVSLPDDYKAFLLFIGHGGHKKHPSAAGPYYGVFPLSFRMDVVVENIVEDFNKPSPLHPKMSDSEWEALSEKINDDNISYEDNILEMRKIEAGSMGLGSQGCCMYHNLIVKGPFKGRIVNMDRDTVPLTKPIFAHEGNFLDWYERWLDEIIDGRLLESICSGLGYFKGGTADSLLEFYDKAEDDFDKRSALDGIWFLKNFGSEHCSRLLAIVQAERGDVKQTAIIGLCKWHHEAAKPYLQALIDGSDETALIAFKAIHQHAQKMSADWAETVRTRMATIDKDETLRFATYILDEAKVDYAQDIIRFCHSENVELKSSGFYYLGKSPTKAQYVPVFIQGLQDKSQRVVYRCLQALEGVRDTRLLEPYYNARKQFERDEYYLETNLEHRVKELGFRHVVDFYRAYRNGTAEKRVKSSKAKLFGFGRSIDKALDRFQ